MNLVELTSKRLDAEPFTTSDVIAEYAGIKTKSVNELIRRYKPDLEEFGILPFQRAEIQGRGQPRKVWHLNEQQATLLITYLGNTKPVRNFKKALTREFFQQRKELALQQAKHELGKEFSKTLHDAIKESPALGEHGHLYININKLVYKQALGVNVNELRQARHIPKADAITNYLSASEADAVRKVKKQITALLEMKLNYQQVKAALQVQGIIYHIQLRLPTKAETR